MLLYLLIYWFLLFWLYHRACEILVPWSGIEPVCGPAVEAWSLNHWTNCQEVPRKPLQTCISSSSHFPTSGLSTAQWATQPVSEQVNLPGLRRESNPQLTKSNTGNFLTIQWSGRHAFTSGGARIWSLVRQLGSHRSSGTAKKTWLAFWTLFRKYQHGLALITPSHMGFSSFLVSRSPLPSNSTPTLKLNWPLHTLVLVLISKGTQSK